MARAYATSVRYRNGRPDTVELTLIDTVTQQMWPAAYCTLAKAEKAGVRWCTGLHPNPCCDNCERLGR